MKKSLATLIVLLLIGALGVSLLFNRDEGRGSAPQGPLPAGQSPLPEELDDVDLSKPGTFPEVANQGTRKVLSPDFKIYGSWQPERMEGRVLWPEGTPADPSLRVLVLSETQRPRDIWGARGILDQLSNGYSSDPDFLLATSEVAADGSFTLPYPVDSERVWLVLDGRHLYMNAVQELGLPATECTLTARLGACLSGRLLLPPGPHGPESLDDAAILAGTVLFLRLDSANASNSSAQSPWSFVRRDISFGPNGGFEFRGLPADTGFALESECELLANGKVDGIFLSPGEERVQDVSFTVGASLAGIVLDPGGQPLQGVAVKYSNEFRFGKASNPVASQTSDEFGQFHLSALPAGKGSLSAEKTGFKSGAPMLFDIDEGDSITDLELQLEAGSSLSGVVRFPDGSLAEGVRILVGPDPEGMNQFSMLDRDSNDSGEGLSDSLGTFHVRGLGDGSFEIDAALQTKAPNPDAIWFARVSGINAGKADIELTLERTSILNGHIVAPDDSPITSFKLQANREDTGNPQASAMRRGLKRGSKQKNLDLPAKNRRYMTIEDPEGAFSIESLSAGSWTLFVVAEGYATSEPIKFTLPDEAAGEHRIQLFEQASLPGLVLNPNGDPVPDARVTLKLEQTEAIVMLLAQREAPSATTDAEGRFLLKPLSPGPQSVFANHDDYAPSAAITIDPMAGQTLPEIRLELARGGDLMGWVYEKDGTPATDVSIIVQDATRLINVTRQTDQEGNFHIENLEPGKYQVIALFQRDAVPGESASAAMLQNIKFDFVDVVEGQVAEISLGQAPANPVQVTGKVTHLGEPIDGAIVSFMPEGEHGFSGIKIASSAADGSYTLELDAAGPYMITAQVLRGGPGQQQQVEYSRTIPKGASFGLDLALPGARISGIIEDTKGAPLASARVSLNIDRGATTGTMLGGQYGEVITNSEGHYSFDYLKEGSYSIAAGGSSFGGLFGTGSPLGREIQSPIRVGAEEHRSGVDFRLGASGDISGKVLDSEGQAVSGASIFVRDERGRLLERFTLTKSDSNGKFQYLGLAPGNYTLSAHGPLVASHADTNVRVRPGEMMEAQIQVGAGTMLRVLFADKTERPLSGTTLSVKNEAGQEMSGMFNLALILERFDKGIQSDLYQVGPLPPGKYIVLAESSDGRKFKGKVRISDRGRAERAFKVTFK